MRQARPADRRLAGLLEPALAHADAATAGEDAGHALAEYVGAALAVPTAPPSARAWPPACSTTATTC
ncbi:hypothetical protein [Kouleothrix sp.]|uniref:hypothetical protein n=1 Tax=Kouleothrix sp. TaxID=2779161 RepID=UPI00391B88BB